MKLVDLFDANTLILNEIFNTRIPITNWQQGTNNTVVGRLDVDDNNVFNIVLEPKIYNFDGKSYNIINVGFKKVLPDGTQSEQLTLNNKQASKILGAIIHAIDDKISQYDYHAVMFIANDNVEKRMNVYNAAISYIGQRFSGYKQNIKVDNNRMATILYAKDITNEERQTIDAHLSSLEK